MKLSPEREYQRDGEPLNFKDRATNLERIARPTSCDTQISSSSMNLSILS